ncbi:hypothetical protein EAE96_004207 [Botrytis aclada]|nr:hypothetical protein EAE96_004207 [Botrytis aclada]
MQIIKLISIVLATAWSVAALPVFDAHVATLGMQNRDASAEFDADLCILKRGVNEIGDVDCEQWIEKRCSTTLGILQIMDV